MAVVVAAAALWSASRGPAQVTPAGDPPPLRSVTLDGLRLGVRLGDAGGIVVADAELRNVGRAPVSLKARCGRVTSAELAKEREPEGRRWTGSLRALKRFVLTSRRAARRPEPMVGERSCAGARRTVRIAPGQVVRERWTTSPAAAGSNVWISVGGRALRLDVPVAVPATARPTPPALLFDRLLADGRLRSWLAAQPADSWRRAEVLASRDEVRFSAVTSGYERAVTARAAADGSHVVARFPGPEDRTRPLKALPVSLPAGIRLKPNGSRATRDVLAGEVVLPSGEIAVDGFPSGDTPALRRRIAPGEHAVRLTLARSRRWGGERVALATLVASDRAPVRWKRIAGIGVDGGVAAFTSTEGAHALDRRMQDDEYFVGVLAALDAHDGQAADLAIEGRLDQVMFSTGIGDGGYPVLAGLDASGRPARFVVDCLLLHLAWPGRPE